MTWPNFDSEAAEKAMATIPQWPSGIYEPMPLHELLQRPTHKTKLEHIHACAIDCMELPEDEWQDCILDYILRYDRSVPLFMSNDVPMYALGYKAGLKANG